MSKESSARGEAKREEIRRIIFSFFKETKEMTPEFSKRLNDHITIMKKRKPQEACLVMDVVYEMRHDPKAWVERMMKKCNQ